MAPLAFSCPLGSAAQTRAFARRLAAHLPGGSVLGLCGELGAGKTTFVQGLARGMGVRSLDEVCSPTYALLHAYPAAPHTLLHLDFYRLSDAAALCDLGIEEQLWRQDCVVAIEWADRFPAACPPHTIWITLRANEAGERHCEVAGLAQPWPSSSP